MESERNTRKINNIIALITHGSGQYNDYLPVINTGQISLFFCRLIYFYVFYLYCLCLHVRRKSAGRKKLTLFLYEKQLAYYGTKLCFILMHANI